MRDNRVFYVVVLRFNGVTHYLEHEEAGTLDPAGKPLKKAVGFFTTDVKDALKFSIRLSAEIYCAGYEGAHVETIKGGERLR